MIKRVYVAQESIINGDEFILDICATAKEAMEAVKDSKAHTTRQEAQRREWFICAWDMEVSEGQSLFNAYREWSLGQMCTPDPVEYIPC